VGARSSARRGRVPGGKEQRRKGLTTRERSRSTRFISGGSREDRASCCDLEAGWVVWGVVRGGVVPGAGTSG
jgi:hypothetical protein